MSDWLREQGPMLETDPRLREYVTENFPPEAMTHVNSVGGVKTFLLQSSKFVQLDDYICVKERLADAQDLVLTTALARFKSPKYMIR